MKVGSVADPGFNDGGKIPEVFEALTGSRGDGHSAFRATLPDIIAFPWGGDAAITGRVQESLNENRPVVVSTGSSTSGNLRGDHAYMVDGVTPNGDLRLMNPWQHNTHTAFESSSASPYITVNLSDIRDTYDVLEYQYFIVTIGG